MAEWLRWRVARLLDWLPGQCWADLVFWAAGNTDRRNPWSPATSTCRTNLPCYCGKFRERDGDGRG